MGRRLREGRSRRAGRRVRGAAPRRGVHQRRGGRRRRLGRQDLLQSRLQAQDPPDTFQAHAGAELQDYIDAAQIEDVSSLYDEFGLTDVFPADLVDRLKSDDGAIYSIPSNIHRANVVWANPTVLKANGVDPAATYADLDAWMADLDKLKAAGVTPLSVATTWTQVNLLETVLLADLGAEGYNGLWDGSTDWEGAEVTAALEDFEAHELHQHRP